MPVSGCKQAFFPLLIAAFLIVLMLVMSPGAFQYSTRLRSWQPHLGMQERLEATVVDVRGCGSVCVVRLCDDGVCLDSEIPVKVLGRDLVGRRVIVEGRLEGERFVVRKLLTRCRRWE